MMRMELPEDARRLQEEFRHNGDFRLEPYQIRGRNFIVCYFVTLIDVAQTNQAIHAYADQGQEDSATLADQLNVRYVPAYEELADAIAEGKMACFELGASEWIVFDPFSNNLNRAISTPQNENSLQSPTQGFIENFQTNLGLLRAQMKSRHLSIQTYQMGKTTLKKIAVCSKAGAVNSKLVESICGCLELHQNRNVNNMQQLLQVLGQKKFSFIPATLTTELPAEAEAHLNNGKAVLFLEGFPFAIIMPTLITDIWSLKSDYNLPYVFMLFTRSLRLIGFLIGVVAPGMYVALVSINPEVLRIQLALSIAQSREGVPYPALIEVLFMLVILEMIVEASVRLPKSIGPTITMVGGVILGEAIVQAKLVSNLLIIVLAATTIANFTLNGVQNALFVRICKYGILLAAAIYGIVGLSAAVTALCIYLAQIQSFGTPYLSVHLKKGSRDD